MAIKTSDPHPSSLKVPSAKGEAPKNRISNSHQVWHICTELDRQDRKRAEKRTRIFKAYNRFPPTDYSKLAKRGQSWQSNVNFGMLAYIIDNNLASFFDMVTERPSAAQIITKKGSAKEKHEWSDHISSAFDMVLKEWDDFLINVEEDLLDMLLYGKGVEMWDDVEGCESEHVSANDILVPDGTKINFKNFDLFAIKKNYTILELWKKLQSGGAEARGWNREAVLNAMRYQRKDWTKKYQDSESFASAISCGDVTPGGHLKEHIETYTLFVKEFDGKISRYTVMRDYAVPVSLTRPTTVKSEDDRKREVINEEGFLFSKTGVAKSVCDILMVFMDCAGSGLWHRTPSLAEKVFIQCRQYDFTMNAIMDAVKINMSLMLQGASGDATDKIKEMVFGPFTIIPADVPVQQQRFALPTQEATGALQFMMLDMFRGIGEYRVHEKGASGEAPTATQAKIDASESAKLSGTQLKRYNGHHTFYYRKFYEKLVGLKDSEKNYELLQKFKDYLSERNVPEEAWKFDNIESITSNMLSGAGSTSFKLMAAEKTIELTNIAPKDEGQQNAVKDALAALHGRSQVGRYIKDIKAEPTLNEQKAGWENEMLSNPLCNPADIKVMPSDNHVYHVGIHLSDMERTIALVNEGMKQQEISEFVAQAAGYRLLNQGAHVMGHFEFLKRDRLKSDMLKEASRRLSEIQGAADKMAKDMAAMQEQKKAEFDPHKDPDIQKKIAMNQLELEGKRAMQEVSTGAMALKHQQRIQQDQEAAANKIAITRAEAATKPKPEKAAPSKK